MTRAGIATVVVFLVASAVQAEAWHVSNQDGNDANDGRSEKRAFATIARAVKAAKTSDSIVLANTGTPCREAIPPQAYRRIARDNAVRLLGR